MFESRITTKGQTTLPKPVRDSLEVKPGDKVRYVIIDEGVLIMPVRPTSRLARPVQGRSASKSPRLWGAGLVVERRKRRWLPSSELACAPATKQSACRSATAGLWSKWPA